MTYEETRFLRNVVELEKTVRFEPRVFTENHSDRTLLYGYNTDRMTWHIYMVGGHVMLHSYSGPDVRNSQRVALVEVKLSDLQSIVPNKRLYPSACDFDFCQWLIRQGIHLSFANWEERLLPETGFHGAL